MRAAAILGPGLAGLVDVAPPRAGGDRVVVRVDVAPMCAEYRKFLAGDTSAPLGHEAAGVVVDAGESSLVSVGDRVVAMPLEGCGRCALCRAGEYIYCQDVGDDGKGAPLVASAMAEYVAKPDWLLVPVPDGVSLEHASMACCGLGASFGSISRIGVGDGDLVLVTGLGPVGLGAVLNCVVRGACVLACDPNPWRRARARELGAAEAIDPTRGALETVLELSGGRGVDVSVECSGAVEAHRLCLDATRRRGSVGFVGESVAPTELRVSPDLLRKGLTLVGSWHYPLSRATELMEQIAALGPRLDLLISHRFGLEEIQTAFETQVDGRSAKVLLTRGGGES